MSKILVDLNIILDVLLDRQPHAAASAAIWAVAETGATEGLLAAHAVTTLHYLIRKELGAGEARRMLATILKVFGVAAVDESVVKDALSLPLPDFEDAVTAAAGRLADCDYIVTRDPKGFRGSPLRCLTPAAAVPMLGKN